jgi:hypothetical protein
VKGVKEGVVYIPDRNIVPRIDAGLRRAETAEWVRHEFTSAGDYMPDSLTVQMPYYSMKEMFRAYKMDKYVDEFYKYNEFSKLVREDFSFLQCRRYKKFSQCSICHAFDKKISTSKVTLLCWFAVRLICAVAESRSAC